MLGLRMGIQGRHGLLVLLDDGVLAFRWMGEMVGLGGERTDQHGHGCSWTWLSEDVWLDGGSSRRDGP